MRFEAVIFDLDGTLLDTIDDLADAANEALARLGFPGHDRESYKRFVGEGVEELIRCALPEEHRDAPSVSSGVAALAETYAGCWNRKTRPYEGIPELLTELSRLAVPTAVLSNKPDHFTRLTVARLLPDWRFHEVVGAKPSVPRKPDPAAALGIAGNLGLAPGRCLYLGDSGVDMRTAVAAGMYPVGALWGFRDARELRDAGAATLIGRPQDILPFLEQGRTAPGDRKKPVG